MDDLSKARRKWKRAEDVVEEAQARLKGAGGKEGAAAAARELAQARKELEDAEDEERKAKRKYRKLKTEKGG
jgi:exonuclease VII small subunit